MTKKLLSDLLMFIFLIITSFPAVFSVVFPIMIIIGAVVRLELLGALYIWKMILIYACMISSLLSVAGPFLLFSESKWQDEEIINRRLKFFVLGMPIIAHTIFVYCFGWFLVQAVRFLKTRFEKTVVFPGG